MTVPCAERIRAGLATRRYGRSLRLLEITESTNDEARRDAADGAPDGHVVVADSQRAGRGSHGRSWSSSAGTDIYASIVARPGLPLSALPPLTLAVGLGVSQCADAVLQAAGRAARTRVKWPNDVWLEGRKCGGVLVEAIAAGDATPVLVVGIGLNVNRTHWPEELAASATSLRGGPEQPPLDRVEVLCGMLAAVEAWVDRFTLEGGRAVARAVDERLSLRGARVRCGPHEGTLIGVADSGALRLATPAGVRELIAGRLEPLAEADEPPAGAASGAQT